jgi:hypothetical protein
MRVLFKAFDSKMASREKLFKAASDFANQVGKDRLITLTHSEDRDNIVITIWYWGEEEIRPGPAGKMKQTFGTFKNPADRTEGLSDSKPNIDIGPDPAAPIDKPPE